MNIYEPWYRIHCAVWYWKRAWKGEKAIQAKMIHFPSIHRQQQQQQKKKTFFSLLSIFRPPVLCPTTTILYSHPASKINFFFSSCFFPLTRFVFFPYLYHCNWVGKSIHFTNNIFAIHRAIVWCGSVVVVATVCLVWNRKLYLIVWKGHISLFLCRRISNEIRLKI